MFPDDCAPLIGSAPLVRNTGIPFAPGAVPNPTASAAIRGSRSNIYSNMLRVAQRHRTLLTETALLEAHEVLRLIIVRAVDDAEILSTATFDRRLEQSSSAARYEIERLDHHALSTRCGERFPPGNRVRDLSGVANVDPAMSSSDD
jgi:hypothetical protein